MKIYNDEYINDPDNEDKYEVIHRYTKYQVRFFMDNEYEVVVEKGRVVDWSDVKESEEVMFKGTLADCHAYIALNDKGYISTMG
jgi:O-glycosyl hydrolase